MGYSNAFHLSDSRVRVAQVPAPLWFQSFVCSILYCADYFCHVSSDESGQCSSFYFFIFVTSRALLVERGMLILRPPLSSLKSVCSEKCPFRAGGGRHLWTW